MPRLSPLQAEIHPPEQTITEYVLVRGEHLREHRIQVGVWDGNGDPVTDLDLADFEITLGGAVCIDSREILDRFAAGTTEVSREELEQIARSKCDIPKFKNPNEKRSRVIAVIVDISGSVAKRELDGVLPEEKMQKLAQYVREGLEEVFDPDDFYIFARFSSVYYVLGPTREVGPLNRVLLRPYQKDWGDGTPYYSIVRIIADKMNFAPENPKAILMFSDCVPFDDLQSSLDMTAREMELNPSPLKRNKLALQKAGLLSKKSQRMNSTLDFSLKLGVPVYNVHYPDEDFHKDLQLKQECHKWIRKTGGRFYYFNGKEADLKKILRQVRADIDNVYILAIRHEELRRKKPKISVRNHRDWKVVFSEEFLSIGSMREVLLHKIHKGDPEERLEAAFAARGYQDGKIREALRSHLFSEVYDEVREVVVDSLFALSLENICASEAVKRDEAFSDIDLLSPQLNNPDKWQAVTHEALACQAAGNIRNLILSWYERQSDPEIKILLYSAYLDWIRIDLEQDRISKALRHAGKLGGADVEKILRNFLEEDHPKGPVRKRIQKFLGGMEPT